jgi:lipopolysaccharide export system permease protein
MPRYVRYILMQLLWPALLITGTLTGIIWLIESLRFIDFIVNRGLALTDFLHITALLFPELLSLLVPIALFLAVLSVYHRLQHDSELTILRAAGVSRLQLAQPAMLAGLLGSVFCYFLVLYLQPISSTQFREMQQFMRENYTSVLLQEEVFSNPTDGLTVFVRERDSNNNLRGILVHDNRDRKNPVTMMAQQGKLMQGPNGPQFYLEQGMRQERRSGRVSWLNFDHYTLDISFYAKNLAVRERKADEYFLPELFNPETTDTKRRNQMRAEGHQRILWPLYSLGLSLLAASMLLCGNFSRRGQWKRILAASIIAILTVLLSLALKNAAVKTPMLITGMYGLLITLAATCLAALAGRLGGLPKASAAILRALLPASAAERRA